MRELRYVLVPLLLAACGGGSNDNKVDAMIIVPDAPPDALEIDAPPDAPSYDFSCMNNPAPTTAAPEVDVSGAAIGVELQGIQPAFVPLTSAIVDACTGNCNGQNKLGTVTTPGDTAMCNAQTGCPFAFDNLPTGGTPLNAYMRLSKAGYVTNNIWPAAPISANMTGVPGLTFTTQAFSAAQAFLGVTQQPTNGVVVIVVTDCALMPIADATVTVKQNGQNVGEIESLGSIAPQAAGTSFAFNVPPGPTEVGATYMGMTLRAHVVTSVAGQLTSTQVRPGF